MVIVLKSQAQKLSWSIYYKKMGDPSWLDMIASLINHQRYLREIIKSKPQSILEVGTGRGLHAIFLSYFMPRVIGIDIEETLIKKAIELNRKFRGRAQFLTIDAFHMGFKDRSFSVCCSQGFFEHFSNSDIQALTKEQLRLARSVIFSVPSHNYPVKNIGDERLIGPKEWSEILKDYLVKIFYYGPNIDSSKGFFGNLKLSALRKAISAPRRAQICAIVTEF